MTDRRDHSQPANKPRIKNADVPSDTAGLPGAAEEASGAHFLRDTIEPTGKATTDEKDRKPSPIGKGD